VESQSRLTGRRDSCNKIRLQRDTIKELDRAVAEDPEELKKWYEEYHGVVTRCGIQATDIWNYDETGFRIGTGKAAAMIQGATEGCISPTLGIQKLGMAALASFHRIKLLEQQVAQMTAAKRHKDEINRSKRRINQISGQPGSFYVSEARKAVKEREDKDAAKKARSEELKRKREAKNTRAKETEKDTTQTLSIDAQNGQNECMIVDYSVPDFMA